MLLIVRAKLLNFLPAAGKRLSKCCACSEGGKMETSEPWKVPAEARAPVARHKTTRRVEREKKQHSILKYIPIY